MNAMAEAGTTPAKPSRKTDLYALICAKLLKGENPSYDVLAKELGVSKARIARLMDQLVDEGLIVRQRGARRAISAPQLANMIVRRLLEAEGYKVDPGQRFIVPPLAAPASVTLEHLPLIAALDHIDGVIEGDMAP